MLVDDDDFLLDMYALKFKESGIEVRAVRSAEDALAAIAGGDVPDLLISDIVMPGMDGIAFLKALNEEGVRRPGAIVMLSNQGQDTDIETAKSLGADGYIIKANAVPSEVIRECLAIYKQATAS
ncbi:response regulator [Patescibacteria group bacterium]|jgi:CheY-like chemotaxis protein|nr:response regulator [Patescibacteria group bacterium]